MFHRFLVCNHLYGLIFACVVCSPGCGSDARVPAAAGGAGEPPAGAPAQPAVLLHPPGHTAAGTHGSDTGHITA